MISLFIEDLPGLATAACIGSIALAAPTDTVARIASRSNSKKIVVAIEKAGAAGGK